MADSVPGAVANSDGNSTVTFVTPNGTMFSITCQNYSFSLNLSLDIGSKIVSSASGGTAITVPGSCKQTTIFPDGRQIIEQDGKVKSYDKDGKLVSEITKDAEPPTQLALADIEMMDEGDWDNFAGDEGGGGGDGGGEYGGGDDGGSGDGGDDGGGDEGGGNCSGFPWVVAPAPADALTASAGHESVQTLQIAAARAEPVASAAPSAEAESARHTASLIAAIASFNPPAEVSALRQQQRSELLLVNPA